MKDMGPGDHGHGEPLQRTAGQCNHVARSPETGRTKEYNYNDKPGKPRPYLHVFFMTHHSCCR